MSKLQNLETRLQELGCTLIAYQSGYVLAERDHGFQRHITWAINDTGPNHGIELYWGHYCGTAAEAKADFEKRIA